MTDTIATAAVFDHVVIRQLRLPGGLYPPQMALLPYAYTPKELREQVCLELPQDDWYEDNGGPCLILGEAKIGANERYYPGPSYRVADAIALTRQYHEPQVAARDRTRRAEEQRTGKDTRLREQVEQRNRAIEELHREEQRKALLARDARPDNLVKETVRLRSELDEAKAAIEFLKGRVAALESKLGGVPAGV